MAARIRQFAILLPRCVELARGQHSGNVRELEAAIPTVNSLADAVEALLQHEPVEIIEETQTSLFAPVAE